jgi:DNA-directed RNA polymerase subunit RPC12/RpoP
VYTGHAAIALALKARDPRVPIVPLALACYGPDWIELALMIPHPRAGMAVYTHSIPAVLLGAAAASALYALIARRPGALTILVGWLLHWPADLITGRKPLAGPQPLIGLDLYHLPVADATLETIIVIAACALYGRAVARTVAQRRVVASLGVALALLQATLDFVLTRIDGQPWHPLLAQERGRPHLSLSASGAVTAVAPHASCTHHSHFHSELVMGTNGSKGVMTLVCLTCGKEKYFTEEVPAAVVCDQCGSTVFRTFMTPTEPDDAAIDALEAQARSMSYGDSSPETTRDDVRDLDLL